MTRGERVLTALSCGLAVGLTLWIWEAAVEPLDMPVPIAAAWFYAWAWYLGASRADRQRRG